MAESEFKIRVGVDIDPSGIQKQLNGVTGRKLKIDIDTTAANNKINTLKKNIESLAKVQVKIGGFGVVSTGNLNSSNGYAKEIKNASSAFKELQSIQRQIKANMYSISLFDADKDKVEIKELEATIESLMTEYNNLYNIKKQALKPIEKTALDRDFNAEISGTKQVTEAYKQLAKASREIGKMKIKIAGLDGVTDTNQIEAYKRQLEELEATYNNLKASLVQNMSETQFDKLSADVTDTMNKLDQLNAKLLDAKTAAANKISENVGFGDFDNDLDRIESKYRKINDANMDLISSMERLRSAKTNFDNASNDFDNAKDEQEKVAAMDRLISSEKEYQSVKRETNNLIDMNARKQKQFEESARASIKVQKELTAQQKLRSDAEKLSKNMDLWMHRNSAAAEDFGFQIKQLQAELKSCDAIRFNGIKTEFNELKADAEMAGKTGLKFTDRLKTQFSKLSSYFSAATVIMAGMQAARQAFQNVLDVDTKLTELYRVTDLTSTQYSNVYDGLTASAKEYGVALTDLISATADWSRAGFDAQTASQLAEVTSVYQHIADLDYGTASENLLTAYKGFESQLTNAYEGDTAAAVGYIADVFNELDNKYSVTAAGIGEALQRSASSLQVAGNTMQESAAMVTGISEVTQDPEKAGNALKVVSMRLRGMKGELQELGEETDENVENLSKMQGDILNLTRGKVNIFDNAGEFKSTYEILQGIAGVWKELSTIEQADLLETIAGKHRANDVAALLGNWQNVEKALVSATEAEGSAMREQEKYAVSLQGRLESLTAALQAISNTALNSNLLKGFVSAATKAIEILDFLIDKLGILPTVAMAAGAGMSFTGKGIFKTVIDEAGEAHIKITDKFQSTGNKIKDIFSGVGQVFGEMFNSVNKKLGGGKSFEFNSFTIDGDFGGAKFINKLNDDIVKLEALKRKVQSLGDDVNINIDDLMDKTLLGASSQAKEFAKSWDLSDEALGEFTKTALESGNVISKTSGFVSNAKNMLSAYNNIVDDSGRVQSKFANAISTFNPQMGTYLGGLNGAKASLSGYSLHLVGATIKTTALKVATIALNTALTMGAAFAIQAVIEGIMHWINAEEELAEKVADVTTEYDNQKKSLSDAKSTINDVADSYEKLSKGVNVKTNENISLSTDEYEEYLGIVNQIGDTFPELISGYDEQGNAILSCAGSVEKLNEAYDNLAKKANNELLDNASDIAKDAKNKSEDIFSDKWKQGKSTEANIHALKTLESLTKSKNLKESINRMGADDLVILTDVLDNYGAEWDAYGESRQEFINRVLTENKETVNKVLSDTQSSMQEAASGMQDIAEATIGNAFIDDTYSNISDEMQNYISGMVPNMDYEFFESLDWDADKLKESINNTLSTINSFDNHNQKKFEIMFDMQSKLNSGECTVGEYVKSISDVEGVIEKSGLDENTQKQLKLSLGLDDNQVVKDVDSFKDKLKKAGIGEDVSNEIVNSLTAAELEAAVNLDLDFTGMDAADIKNKIAEEAETIEALSFTVDIKFETENLENLNTAVSEALSGTGLSTESISNVEGMFKGLSKYDPSKLFERTANGIRMNTDEFRKLNSEYANEKMSGLNNKMSVLGDEYNRTKEELYDLTYGTEEYNVKANELSALEKQINETEQLTAQYKGLTSAYNQWQMAESAGSQRDMYESIISGFENVEDELSRGWVDDATIEFMELLSGKDLSTAGIDKLKSTWDGLGKTIKDTNYSVKDFFTTNKDGESTSDGVYNFLDAIGQLEEEKFGGKDVVQRDKNGIPIGFDFNMVGGDAVIAEALGVSEELVQIMVRAADDAGFVVSMDGTYKNLDILKEKAQESAATLNAIFEKHGVSKVDFNFNASTIEEIEPQLKNAKAILDDFRNEDGTINMDIEGAEEAYNIASTLQSMLDKLQEPAYMDIQTDQVEKELRDPLTKLQEYERLTQTENQLKLKGADTSEIEKSKDEIIDYFDELQESNPEIAAQLEIEGLSREDIEKKVDSGELKIPATVDLQMEMDDKLSILVDKALLDAGIIDDEEFEKRVSVYVDADVNAEETKEDIDKKIDEALSGENNLTEDQEINIKAFAEVFGTGDLDELKTKLSSLEDKDFKVLAEVFGKVDVEKLKSSVDSLDDKTVQAIAKAMGEGDIEGLKTAIKEIPDKKVAQAIAQAFGYSDVDALCGAIDGMDGKTVQAIAQALGITDVDSLRGAVDRLDDKNVKATVDTAGQADKVNSLQSTIDGLKGKTVTIWASIKKTASDLWGKLTGGGGVDGSAHVSGTAYADGTTGRAFKQGDWGTKDDGVALGGELGPELLVRNGRWYTIGEKSAEFFGYKKGDIIFNADQTKEIFEKGKITHGSGRGKALASGTAFSTGSGGGWGRPGTGLYNSSSSPSSSSSSKKSSSKSKPSNSDSKAKEDAKEFEEVLDWIEIAIDRIERSIKNLDTVASSAFRSWSERTSSLNKQIAETRNEIDLQQRAYDRYIQQANSVGLDAGWAQKVRDGAIDITTITDEDLHDKISEYQDWYNKALDARDAIIQLKEAESELYKQRFDNVSAKFDGYLGVIQHEKDMLDEFVSQSEAKGYITSTKYYEAMSKNTNDKISELNKKRDEMTAELNAAVDSGKIAKGSEAWYEMINEIDDVTLEIEKANTELLEFSKTIRELKWEQFDLIQDKISNITAESEFLIELMSNKNLYDDNGQLTDEGKATMGLHGVNYNTHMNQADRYGQEIKNLDAEIAKDPYNQDLIKRRQELIEKQRESILAAEDEKNAIRDMVEEGINKELDALDELINKRNDALDSAKDLYSYQKKIAEQTKEIADIEKQLGAYAGDDSEEARATIQELKVSLQEAKDNLEETEYDRYISDQKQLMDDLYLEYETILNARLDNIDALIASMIEQINTDSGVIKETLEKQAESVGTTLSGHMDAIWNADGAAGKVITMYGDKFSNAQTTTNNVLNGIAANIKAMLDYLDKKAGDKTNQASNSSASKPKPPTQPPTPEPSKPSNNGGDGVPKVGDAVKYNSGKYYYSSDGLNPAGSAMLGQTVYITQINTASWAKKPYHIARDKAGTRPLGWLTLSQISGYSTGNKRINNDELAWTQENGAEIIVRPSDGAILTPLAKNDSVLTSAASSNIWNMANNPADFIKDNLGTGVVDTPINNGSNNSYTQNIDKVVFNMPNVKNYEQLIRTMQKDKDFERLIMAMTVDRLAGGSSLSKNRVLK